MFWIGLIVGIVIATIAIGAWLLWGCYKTYGTFDTFVQMCEVTQAASENREAIVTVTHDGEILETAVFEEME